MIPWVDKTIAIVACLPFAVELYRRWAVGHVNFPRAVLGLQLLVHCSNGAADGSRSCHTESLVLASGLRHDLHDAWLCGVCRARSIADFPDCGEWIRDTVGHDSHVCIGEPRQKHRIHSGAT